MAGERHVFLDQPLRHRMHGNKPDFAAPAVDPEQHALPALRGRDELDFECCVAA